MSIKITVVGAGNVGATCAFRIIEQGYADVVLLDIVEGLARGKALDMMQATPMLHVDRRVTGTSDYAETEGSDVVVITSGMPRKPGMSRDDLAVTNMNIVKGVTEKVVRYSPGCIIVVVCNPLDVMTHVALKVSGFQTNRVMGQSGALDSARLRYFIARKLNVSVEDVSACVLGGHGDTMLPLMRLCTAGGMPVSELMTEETMQQIVKSTVNAGADIVALIEKGSAFYAPAIATAMMVDSIVMDRKRIIPSAVFLEGEYGIDGVVTGVPVKIGKEGVEQIMKLQLTPEESDALNRSAEAVRSLTKVVLN